MKVKIYPSKVSGEIVIPPSKSMSHRAIICASLADGTSTISNVAYSEDIKVTIEGMRCLGAKIDCEKDKVTIRGIKDFTSLKTKEIFCNESGSTLRFFIPIFSLCNEAVTFTGRQRLLKRPQSIYETIFKKQNIYYEHTEEFLKIHGTLKGGEYNLDGNISSQFISGLLFALPLLEEDSIIHINEPYESRSYVDLTLQMLHNFGIRAYYSDTNTLVIPGKQKYCPFDYEIEGDYSQLAFFAVLAAINNDLTIKGISHSSLQGDRKIIEILRNAGAFIQQIEHGFIIHKSQLQAEKIDLQDCPDLGPILNVLAMYTQGETCIYNAARLRIKESDRIAAMEEELLKCEVNIHTNEEEIYISGKDSYKGDCIFDSHNDHRIVMSLSVAATMFDQPVFIENANAISKSYPSFFEDLKKINVKVEIFND